MEIGRTRFPAYSIGKVMMVKTPDRSLSLKQLSFMHRRGNVSIPLRLSRPKRSTKPREGLEAYQNNINSPQINPPQEGSIPLPASNCGARGYGSGPGRQGIARHGPPCPAALHLDCPALRQDCAAMNCLRKSAWAALNKTFNNQKRN